VVLRNRLWSGPVCGLFPVLRTGPQSAISNGSSEIKSWWPLDVEVGSHGEIKGNMYRQIHNTTTSLS
jgi:hypothetical protein